MSLRPTGFGKTDRATRPEPGDLHELYFLSTEHRERKRHKQQIRTVAFWPQSFIVFFSKRGHDERRKKDDKYQMV